MIMNKEIWWSGGAFLSNYGFMWLYILVWLLISKQILTPLVLKPEYSWRTKSVAADALAPWIARSSSIMHILNFLNTLAADALASCVTRSSATICILCFQKMNIVQQGLIWFYPFYQHSKLVITVNLVFPYNDVLRNTSFTLYTVCIYLLLYISGLVHQIKGRDK